MTETPRTPQVDLIGLIVNREAADRALIHPGANAATDCTAVQCGNRHCDQPAKRMQKHGAFCSDTCRSWARRHPEDDARKERMCLVKRGRKPQDPSERYAEWRATPDGEAVYKEVLNRVWDMKSKGFKSFGMRCIWEAIRYDFTLRLHGDDEFRLNNNFAPFMAREVMAVFPGFFELRKAEADRE